MPPRCEVAAKWPRCMHYGLPGALAIYKNPTFVELQVFVVFTDS